MALEGKKDFSGELQLLIPESIEVAQSKGMDEAILLLLGFEKKCRVNNDYHSLKETCLHIIRLCRQREDWEKINSLLSILNKRRAQNKLTITAIVEEAMSYIDQTPTKADKIALIKTLMSICEGKIYVEAESARLHLILAFIYEEDGDISNACATIQDVHVETYGSIPREEKAEYIYHQTRFNILNKDFVRALIQSRKMNRKTIDEPNFEEVKIKFYKLMVEYYSHESDHWEICQCFYKIFDTPKVKEDPQALQDNLKTAVSFLLLSKYDNQRQDMLHRVKALKELQALSSFSAILTLFTTNEVIPFPFPHQEEVEAAIRSSQKSPDDEKATEFCALLRTRVTEHNIRVLHSYYTRIHSSRMATMLGLTVEELEEQLSEMSSSGDIFVKIDRPQGIISFAAPSAPEEVLSDWAGEIGSMLSLMESTCHLINRENMVHKIA